MFKNPAIYQDDWLRFYYECLSENKLWDKEVEIFKSVQNNERTIVPSGHSVGKTYITGAIALTFLYIYMPSIVITTAPTWRQVKNLLWGEIRSLYNNSIIELGGELLTTELKLAPKWYALGFSTERDTGGAVVNRFQGFHEENILIVLDEAPGIHPLIWEAVEGIATSQNYRILAIGNPIQATGPFYEACKDSTWNTIQISCYDHPNVKEDKIIYPKMVTRKWVEERKGKWGENSSLFLSRVKGEFPKESSDNLILLAWVVNAGNREIIPDEKDIKSLGCDIARFGNDDTVLTAMQGRKVIDKEFYNGKDTMRTVGEIIRLRNKYKIADERIGVDVTGVGSGVVDRLHEQEIMVQAINFGGNLKDYPIYDREEHYCADLGTAMYKELSKDLERDDIDIYNDETIEELPTIRTKILSNGKTKLESKDERRRRGVGSPDHSDSLVIANWMQKGYNEIETGGVEIL